jgi:hypothetical protein
MKSLSRFIGPLLIICILAIQLATPTVALADDPPAAEETPVVAPEDPPADEGSDVEPTPTVSEILDAAPDGTEVVVLDSEGEELPLDTLDAVEVIAASDPVWCPSTATGPNDGTCTPSQTTFTDLVAFLTDPANSSYSGDGTIYFQEGPYTSGETNIFVSSSVLENLGAITISGGWDIAGGTQIGSGVTTFAIPIVVNWTGDVTLEDLWVVFAAPGNLNEGIYVSTTDVVDPGTGTILDAGDITLDDVYTQNGSVGADLNNYAGTGDVSVTGSSFNDNTNQGLRVDSAGAVNVTDIGVSGNNTGVQIDNTSGTASVTLDYVNASNNDMVGIDVRSSGGISVSNSIITNSYQGMYLDDTSGSGGVTVSGVELTMVDDLGVKIITNDGNIAISNLEVDNGDYPGSIGAWVKSYGGGTIDIANSVFQNAGTGLFVVGTNDVTLTNVHADSNAGNGAEIQSGWVFACIPPEGINVTVTGGSYSDNGGYGFAVYPGPTGNLTLAGTINFLPVNGNGDYLLDLTRTCTPCPEDKGPGKPYKVVEVPDTGGTPEPSDCDQFDGTILVLPDGSTAKVACPVDGDFLVERLTEDQLPGALPLGPLFVDSLTIGLAVGEDGSTLLTDGGYYLVSFKIPEELKDKHFSIMFWDVTLNEGSGGWLELPREEFAGQVIPLHPKAPEDGMQILRGVYNYDGTVSVKVNFTGTFALIAR